MPSPRCIATFSLVVSTHSGGTSCVKPVWWNPPSLPTSSSRLWKSLTASRASRAMTGMV
jgi:hypothetical protein